jgi:spore coat assembly protein SafA
MLLTPMRYKDYTWPHNPEVYSVEYQRRLTAHAIPYGQCVMEDLGSSYRVLKGEGVFAGADAYQEFQKLVAVFQEDGAGLLVHPVWQTERAWFASLTVEEEPLPNYVRYSFEFWEDWGGYDSGLKEVAISSNASSQNGSSSQTTAAEKTEYTVRKGDTLWGIAKRYHVTLTALIAANPKIKNPNLIYPGDKVTIP